jgi:small subunit ribosomal protein S35
VKKMVKDQYFNMDDKKWPDIVEDGVKHYVI